jgi:hypothetical protein
VVVTSHASMCRKGASRGTDGRILQRVGIVWCDGAFAAPAPAYREMVREYPVSARSV